MELSNYIFLTDERITYQPGMEKIENLQVIKIIQEYDERDAFNNLLKKNQYLRETNFDELFCYKLDNSNQSWHFNLKD